jgi:hypothetical protein
MGWARWLRPQFAEYCVFLIRHEMAKYFWLAGVIDIRG